MDVSRISLAVNGFRPTRDNTTFQYVVNVSYGRAEWSLTKRFSEFVKLHNQLIELDGLQGLPSLPSKTLLGRPQDADFLRLRQRQLEGYLHALLERPDTRTADSFVRFLDFESQTHAVVRSLTPLLIGNSPTSHFGVSSLVSLPEERAVIIGQEDASSLAKLGKVWQVVEPDDVGALSVWMYSNSGSRWKRVAHSFKSSKVRALFFQHARRRLFVGYDSGNIDLFRIPDLSTFEVVDQSPTKASTSEEPEVSAIDFTQPEVTFRAHEGAVMYFHGSDERLLSLGYDGSLRVISLLRGCIESGGRLSKRLGEKSHLTVGYLDDQNDRVFLGTSTGTILIYSIAQQPPQYLHSVDLGRGEVVSAIEASECTLFIAHSDSVSSFALPHPGEEKRMARLGQYIPPLSNGGSKGTLSLTLWPDRERILVGHDEALCCWDLTTGKCFAALRILGGVNTIDILPEESSSSLAECILIGSGSGAAQLWKFAPPTEYVWWINQETKDNETLENGPQQQPRRQDESNIADERNTKFSYYKEEKSYPLEEDDRYEVEENTHSPFLRPLDEGRPAGKNPIGRVDDNWTDQISSPGGQSPYPTSSPSNYQASRSNYQTSPSNYQTSPSNYQTYARRKARPLPLEESEDDNDSDLHDVFAPAKF